jgi:hypothetical protein
MCHAQHHKLKNKNHKVEEGAEEERERKGQNDTKTDGVAVAATLPAKILSGGAIVPIPAPYPRI